MADMPASIPIYRNQRETYIADTCRPLSEAAARGEIRLEALVRGHYPGRRLPPGALPGLKTIGFWDAKDDQNWGFPSLRNEGIKLAMLETGSLGFGSDAREYVLQPDDLTITRPWQIHRLGSPCVGVGRWHWLILDVGVRRPNQGWKWPSWLLLSPPDRAELTNILRHNEQPVWRATPEMRRCVQFVAHAVETDRQGSSLSRIAVHINELLMLLLEMFRRKRKEVRLDSSLSSSRRTVQLFLADLRSHPEHLELEWSVQSMARSCGLGVTRFVHHVRALTNMSPAHFLKHCRLDLAAKALRESRGATITDIALACGFASSQYFATVFAQRFSCSPREFRTTGQLVHSDRQLTQRTLVDVVSAAGNVAGGKGQGFERRHSQHL